MRITRPSRGKSATAVSAAPNTLFVLNNHMIINMSFSINAGGTYPFSIRTPLVLDKSTRTLYNRAISDPSSLTGQERRLITYRSPPDEEDTLCRIACGLYMGEIVTKAINSSNNNDNKKDDFPLSSLSLSYKEASLLTAGVVKGQSGHILSEVVRLSPEDIERKEMGFGRHLLDTSS